MSSADTLRDIAGLKAGDPPIGLARPPIALRLHARLEGLDALLRLVQLCLEGVTLELLLCDVCCEVLEKLGRRHLAQYAGSTGDGDA